MLLSRESPGLCLWLALLSRLFPVLSLACNTFQKGSRIISGLMLLFRRVPGFSLAYITFQVSRIVTVACTTFQTSSRVLFGLP